MRALHGTIGALAVMVAIGAIPAGILLLTDPSGGAIGLPSAVLEGTPFPDFAVPGALLAFVVGGSQIAACVAVFALPRRVGVLGAAAGAVLVGWIVTQVMMIGLVSALQPILLAAGIVELVLGGAALRAARDPR